MTIGMPPTPGEFIAPALLERIKSSFPDIELRFFEGFSSVLEQKLSNNEIGIAVMHDPEPRSEITITKMLVEHLWVVGSSGSLTKKSYKLAEAAALPLILPSRPNFLRILIDSHAERNGLELNVVQRSDGVWHTKALVRYGHGQTILTYGAVLSEMQQGTLDAVPITDPRIDWTLCLAMRRDQSRKPAFRIVSQAIQEIVSDLVARAIWR